VTRWTLASTANVDRGDAVNPRQFTGRAPCRDWNPSSE
jgi:hypothetical protein